MDVAVTPMPPVAAVEALGVAAAERRLRQRALRRRARRAFGDAAVAQHPLPVALAAPDQVTVRPPVGAAADRAVDAFLAGIELVTILAERLAGFEILAVLPKRLAALDGALPAIFDRALLALDQLLAPLGCSFASFLASAQLRLGIDTLLDIKTLPKLAPFSRAASGLATVTHNALARTDIPANCAFGAAVTRPGEARCNALAGCRLARRHLSWSHLLSWRHLPRRRLELPRWRLHLPRGRRNLAHGRRSRRR